MESLYGSDITVQELQEEDVDPKNADDLAEYFIEDALDTYEEREKALGPELAREVERFIILQTVDQRWREHLEAMDYLREGRPPPRLRAEGPAGRIPRRGDTRCSRARDDHSLGVVFTLFHVTVEIEQPALEPIQARESSLHYEHETSAGADVIAAAGIAGAATALAAPSEGNGGSFAQAPVVNEHKDLGRNDPCWCGSGKKYKRCHGA
jgi:preprotein translocase subunit SecA